MTQRSIRGKLVLKDLGNPDAIKAMASDIKRLVLGQLIGMASGFVERTDPKTGEQFEGLSGLFRSVPADKSEDELESGVLFIPDAFHNVIASKLREVLKADPSASVNFAFEVASIRASNPQGRSWDFKPLWDEAENPIDRLIKAQPLQVEDKSNVKTIEPPKTATGGKK